MTSSRTTTSIYIAARIRFNNIYKNLIALFRSLIGTVSQDFHQKILSLHHDLA
jgi:hypothetical protein